MTGGELGTKFFSSVLKFDPYGKKMSYVRSMKIERSFHSLVSCKGKLLVTTVSLQTEQQIIWNGTEQTTRKNGSAFQILETLKWHVG